jgi:hypothetical protein
MWFSPTTGAASSNNEELLLFIFIFGNFINILKKNLSIAKNEVNQPSKL